MTVRAPDYIEPLVGWRAWTAELTYRPDGTLALHLHSLYFPLHWPQLERAVARCGDGDAPCLNDAHLCGVHATKTLAHAAKYLPVRLREPRGWASRPTQVVLGTVELSGVIVEHKDGYRAAEAYPRELHVPAIFKARGADVYASDAREMLEDGYRVRVRVFRRWDDLVPVAA